MTTDYRISDGADSVCTSPFTDFLKHCLGALSAPTHKCSWRRTLLRLWKVKLTTQVSKMNHQILEEADSNFVLGNKNQSQWVTSMTTDNTPERAWWQTNGQPHMSESCVSWFLTRKCVSQLCEHRKQNPGGCTNKHTQLPCSYTASPSPFQFSIDTLKAHASQE